MKNFVGYFIAFLFFISFSAVSQITNEPPVDGLFPEESWSVNKQPIPYPSIRKADVMWSKRIWREIDFRQKFNQKFYYPLESQSNWKSFIMILLDALKEGGQMTAYETSNTDELLVPITYNEIMGKLNDTSSITFKRTYYPYEDYDSVIISQFDPGSVMKLRIKEDWYFDKQRSQMMVRIIAVCPVRTVEVNGQEGPEPMFWISYAEARDVFAQALVFNEFNSAMRLTYDELFWKRLFDSYIYKEENVYDRYISQYARGMDALLESERVKKDMFRLEEDLWQY